MRGIASLVLLLACPALAWAQDHSEARPRTIDARLRSEITAVSPLDAEVPETDLDLDSRVDVTAHELLLPELAGRLSFRDRRDLNGPPQGSSLRDTWDVRSGRDQERLELLWLEFGDRLALRAGRQLDWAGAAVRYDGASLRLRRAGPVMDAYAFAGRRARLDALDEAPLDAVAGGRIEVRVGQSIISASSLYRDHHLLDIGFSRQLGRRGLFDNVRLQVGYSQLDLRSRDARVGADVSLRRLPLRLFILADARLTRSEDEFVFDYTTSLSESATRDIRLHLEPLPPSVLVSAGAFVHPTPATSISIRYARRQLFTPAETTALSFSHHELSLGADTLDEDSGLYGSATGSVWLADLGDPETDPPVTVTRGEGERASYRVAATFGVRGRLVTDASLSAAYRTFRYDSTRSKVSNINAAALLARVAVQLAKPLSMTVWAAYDEALPVLDQELRAALAGGLRLELRTP